MERMLKGWYTLKGFMKAMPIVVLLLVILWWQGGIEVPDIDLPMPEQSVPASGVVREIRDGDQLLLKAAAAETVNVRLLGVSAPSLEQCGGKPAAAALTELALDEEVALSSASYNKFKTLEGVATVVGEPRSLQEQLLARGWVTVAANVSPELRPTYVELSAQAKAAGLGRWGLCSPAAS